MNLGPICLLVGWVWGPCLQVGRSQGQVPTYTMRGVPAGQWWEDGERGGMVERPLGEGWPVAPEELPLAEDRDLCHSQAPRGSAQSAGPGSLRIRGCQQKAPRMLSGSAFLGVRD